MFKLMVIFKVIALILLTCAFARADDWDASEVIQLDDEDLLSDDEDEVLV